MELFSGGGKNRQTEEGGRWPGGGIGNIHYHHWGKKKRRRRGETTEKQKQKKKKTRIFLPIEMATEFRLIKLMLIVTFTTFFLFCFLNYAKNNAFQKCICFCSIFFCFSESIFESGKQNYIVFSPGSKARRDLLPPSSHNWFFCMQILKPKNALFTA